MTLIRFVLGMALAILLHSCLNVSANSDRLQVAQAYPVRQDVLAIQINTGRTLYGEQVPYEPQIGDRLDRKQRETWVRRGTQAIGALAGQNEDILYTFDRYTGKRLDPDWADQPISYSIVSATDAAYETPAQPTAVYRKSKPTDMARTGPWEFDWPLSHVLYLQLPQALTPGQTYEVQFQGAEIEPVTVQYQPDRNPSEAVHVSQVGFRPDDPAKVAFLSTWMGNGGPLDYPEGLNFQVIHTDSQQAVYTGQTQLAQSKDEPEDPRKRNYTLTDVYQMEFSSVQQPGNYQVCVETVGCSFPFAIAPNTWQDAFKTSIRGLYHQRSGIELGPPHTDVERPRPFHPDDGLVVYQSGARLMDTTMGIGDRDAFDALIEAKTDEVVPDAWGGYFDAGDWDRRAQHLEIPRLLFELADLFPDYFATVNLNLPESQNELPDLVDEALWGLDFYRRLQTSEGGIRGGIESERHPKYGETSWQESWTVMAYAPDAWSSYLYAGVAARAAHWFDRYLPELANSYAESALRAMDYAEQEYTAMATEEVPQEVRDERNLAAIELYRLTGDPRWHDLFLATTVYTDPEADMYKPRSHQQRDAAFVYAQLASDQVDAAVQTNATNALFREADRSIQLGQTTAFRWTKMQPYAPVGWGHSFGAPKVMTLLRAHALTGDERYLAAAVLGCQFAAGANPDNMVYTTGIGHRSPQHPNTIDQRLMGEPPPPGITVYGPLDLIQFDDYWTVDLFREVTFPAPEEWPTVEAYFDVYKFPAVTEFTVMETIAPTAYAWGYLAARN